MSSKALLYVVLTISLLLLMACSGVGNTGEGSVPTWEGFLTPVAEAQQRGIKPYWLGAQFEASGQEAELDPFVQLFEPKDGHPGLSMSYYGSSAGLSLSVISFSKYGEGWKTMRDRAVGVGGALNIDTMMGRWPAEVISVPIADRPVNSLVYVIQIDDAVVIAHAGSGSTGIPGTDVNPLIDSKVLAPLLGALRPYPE